LTLFKFLKVSFAETCICKKGFRCNRQTERDLPGKDKRKKEEEKRTEKGLLIFFTVIFCWCENLEILYLYLISNV